MDRLVNSKRGFTLIELVVTVAILGILAGVAIPAYSSQMEKGRLADARSALSQNGLYMERWYADNGTYKRGTSSWPTLPVTSTDYYSIAIVGTASSADGSSYLIEARPLAQFNSASAKYLKLDQDGNIRTCQAPGGVESCTL